MRNLTYIKLFEAFESNKLGKTLAYLNKNSRKDFLDRLKRICSDIDMPESKLSDDIFKYLPYSAAIKYNGDVDTETDTKCPAENCIDGKIPGAGNRRKICPMCKGTDRVSLPKRKSQLSLVKFWFDKDGKFIRTTGVDGIFRPNNVPSESVSNNISFSTDITDYEIGERIAKTRISELKPGDIIKFTMTKKDWNNTISVVKSDVIGYVYIDKSRYKERMFILQNVSNGSETLYDRSKIDLIAPNHWFVNSSSIKDINRLVTKNVGIDNSLNPFGYNTMLGDNLNIIPTNIENYIKDANFAIVLDIVKLNGKQFVKKTDVIANRQEIKKDTLAFEKDIDIKSANINRYFKEIFDRSKFKGNVKDIFLYSKIIVRLLGGRYCIYNLNGYSNDTLTTNIPNKIANRILEIMYSIEKSDDLDSLINSDEFKSSLDQVNDLYRDGVELMNRRNKSFGANMDKFKTDILAKRKMSVGDEDQLRVIDSIVEVVDLLDQLSLEINGYFMSLSCECIEDIEIFLQEILAIKRIIANDRSHITALNGLFGDMTNEWRSVNIYNSLYYYREDGIPNKIIPGLKRLISIIKRKRELIVK